MMVILGFFCFRVISQLAYFLVLLIQVGPEILLQSFSRVVEVLETYIRLLSKTLHSFALGPDLLLGSL